MVRQIKPVANQQRGIVGGTRQINRASRFSHYPERANPPFSLGRCQLILSKKVIPGQRVPSKREVLKDFFWKTFFRFSTDLKSLEVRSGLNCTLQKIVRIGARRCHVALKLTRPCGVAAGESDSESNVYLEIFGSRVTYLYRSLLEYLHRSLLTYSLMSASVDVSI